MPNHMWELAPRTMWKYNYGVGQGMSYGAKADLSEYTVRRAGPSGDGKLISHARLRRQLPV